MKLYLTHYSFLISESRNENNEHIYIRINMHINCTDLEYNANIETRNNFNNQNQSPNFLPQQIRIKLVTISKQPNSVYESKLVGPHFHTWFWSKKKSNLNRQSRSSNKMFERVRTRLRNRSGEVVRVGMR